MENTSNLDRLCGVYRKLSDTEKGTIIRLAEGLLDDQQSVDGERRSFMKNPDREVEQSDEMGIQLSSHGKLKYAGYGRR